MKKLICRLLGHDYRYNFPSIPNKCICYRCSAKFEFGLKSLEWSSVNEFFSDRRTDEELKDKWFKL